MPRRCANPLRNTGVKGHNGKNLRLISWTLREKYPHLPQNAMICDNCRKKTGHFQEIVDPAPVQHDETFNESHDDPYELEEPDFKRFRPSSPSTSQQNIIPGVPSDNIVRLEEDEAHRCRESCLLSISCEDSCSEVRNDASNDSTELKEDKAEHDQESSTLLTLTSSLSIDNVSDNSSESWMQSTSENTSSQNSNMPISSRAADLESIWMH